jgi:hypothetical protein
MTALQSSPVLHVTLPRASTLTDVLLSPPGAKVEAEELAKTRERLVTELRRASSGVPRGTTLRIDAYRLQMALTGRPGALGGVGSFSPSPASCRRAIGVAAVAQCARNPALAPSQAVARVLERATAPHTSIRESSWWAEWFRRQPIGAKAVVQSEAVVWATQLYGSLEWDRIGPRARIGCDLRWVCPGSPQVTLHAKVDVQGWAEGRPVLLVASTGVAGPHWSPALALTALATGLSLGAESVPARVVGIWPSSGQIRILPVERGTLETASKHVVEAADALTGTQRQAG